MSKLRIDTKGNEKQKAALIAWNDQECIELLYGGAKGGAKSHTGVFCVFAWAFLFADTKYFIARKNRSDLTRYTIASINKVLIEWGLGDAHYNYNAQSHTYTVFNKQGLPSSEVILLSCEYQPSDPDYKRFGSAQYTRGWIEEAGEVPADAKTHLLASVGRWNNEKYDLKGKILITCNPAKNWLYTDFYLPFTKGVLPLTKCFIQALITDNKMIDKGYIEHLSTIYSQAEKRRFLEGKWEFDDDARTLIQFEKIGNLFSNSYLPKGEKYITADLAGYGADATIIWLWEGFRGKCYEYYNLGTQGKIDAIEAIRIANNISKSNVSVDNKGLGEGTAELGQYVPFDASTKPINAENEMKMLFLNLRSQCWYNLAKRINENGYYLDCTASQQEKAMRELEQVKCTDESLTRGDGQKFQVVSSKEIKEIIGKSPDFVSAMAQREMFELKQEINYEAFFIS